MKLFCIADEQTVRGFRLAGVDGRAASSGPEALAAFEAVAGRGDCGVVVVTETVARDLGECLETIRMERDRPLIVEIPGPEGPLPGRRSLRELVQAAVGIRLGEDS